MRAHQRRGPFSERTALHDATYHFRHGPFDLTVLSDGWLVVPAGFVAQDAPPTELEAALAGSDALRSMVYLRTNVPLIRHGQDLILVDAGGGKKFQSTEGLLPDALRANGIDPASITKVVLTHAHPDHLWGLLDPAQKLQYPNAAYYVGASEWEFWMAPGVALQLPPDFRGVVPETRQNLEAIQDRVTLIKPGDEIVGGIRVLKTPGHTLGHVSLELAGGTGLIITADAVTHERISFEHPTWRNGFDFDSGMAIQTRTAFLERAAKGAVKLLGYHFAYPGIGYCEAAGNSFRFIPAA